MKTYSTSEIARIIGIHPNTVRRYEELELITAPERLPNGYRRFSDEHLLQFRLARAGFGVEVLQSGLRGEVVAIVKAAAARDYASAVPMAENYLAHLRRERENAEEAIVIARQLLTGLEHAGADTALTRREAADLLHVTIDTLRNWELNGLLTAKRRQNGYRVYNARDIRVLKLIRTLRLANYSLAAILRMMNAFTGNPGTDLRDAIDTPRADEDIVAVCDRLLTSLASAEQNAGEMIGILAQLAK